MDIGELYDRQNMQDTWLFYNEPLFARSAVRPVPSAHSEANVAAKHALGTRGVEKTG